MTFTEFDVRFRSKYRRTSSALTSTFFIISDLLGVMASFGWGFFLVKIYDKDIISFYSFINYWPYLPIFILIFQILGLYPGISLAPAEEFRRFFLGIFGSYGSIIVARSINMWGWDSRNSAFLISVVFAMPIFMVLRNITHWMLYKTGLGGIPAVVYGSGSTARLAVDRLLGSIKTGYVPVLILDDDPLGPDKYKNIPIIHDTKLGPEIVKKCNIKMAIVAMPKMDSGKLKILLNKSVSAFRYSVIIPDFFNETNIWMSIRDFDGMIGFVTSHKLKMPWNLVLKRFMDITLTIIIGIILFPFLFFIALLIKLDSPGTVFYAHKRMGKNGKPFNAYKFRSMAADSDERLKKILDSNPEIKREWEENHKLKNDPRITKIGKFLRRTSIDEFPQLINILKGEMSLAGPRPITAEEVKKYGKDFKRIFSIKPGLTGMWQVSGRSETDYAARVSYDSYYLQSWSVWLDVWIIFKTFGAVLRRKGAY